MDAQNKLRQAHLKARGDKAGARGGAGAGSGSGLGSDKGRGKSGGLSGGGRGSGSGRQGSGGARGPGQQRSPQRNGAHGNASGSHNSRTPTKAPGGGPGGRAHGSGPKGPGSPRGGSGGGSGGSGRGGNQPKGAGSSGTTNRSPKTPTPPKKTLDPHKPGNRPWKDGGRGGGGKLPGAGGATGPWKDKPTNKPASPNGKHGGGSSGAWPVNKTPTPPKKTIDPHKPGSRPWKDDPRPGPKPTGPGSKSTGSDAKTSNAPKPSAPKGGTAGTFGAGRVFDPHKPGERPWKPPLKGAEPNRDKNPGTKSTPGPGAPGGTPINLTKDKPKKKEAPSGGPAHEKAGKDRARKKSKKTTAGSRPDEDPLSDRERFHDQFWEIWEERAQEAFEQYDGDWSDESINAYLRSLWHNYGHAEPGTPRWSFFHKTRKRFEDILENRRREREKANAEARARRGEGTVTADSVGITVERDDPPPSPDAEPATQPAQGQRPENSPAGLTRGVPGLPPAPTPHTQRPGTTRPDSQEHSVADTQVAHRSTQGGLAVKHQTDITFDEYLIEMTSIAVQAGADGERAEAVTLTMTKVVALLKEMAADLADDHNVGPKVTGRIEAATERGDVMEETAQRFASMCADAFEGGKLAAGRVAKVYGEDMDAKQDAGIDHVSAAVHHN
ncbi:hypothetical protein ACOKM5_43595 [Streptomyces sp. BH097]